MATSLLSRSLLSRAAFACRACAAHSPAQTSVPFTISRAQRQLSTAAASTRTTQNSILAQAVQSRTKRTYATAAPSPLVTTQPKTNTTKTNPLTWDQFFATRSRRRFLTMGMGVAFAITAAVFGSPLIGALDLDTSIAQATGVEPLVVVMGGSFVVAIVGWFLGRVAGGVAFSLYARQGGWQRIFIEKEKSFFARIKRYRADPSSSSPQNPIPDYYGEKVSSVKDYRRWLKDQRAFTKKMYRDVR